MNSLSSFKVGCSSLQAKMGKRKIDPATGKPIPFPSDLNRKKRKLRTAAEKIARNESAGGKESTKRDHRKVSVSRAEVSAY